MGWVMEPACVTRRTNATRRLLRQLHARYVTDRPEEDCWGNKIPPATVDCCRQVTLDSVHSFCSEPTAVIPGYWGLVIKDKKLRRVRRKCEKW